MSICWDRTDFPVSREDMEPEELDALLKKEFKEFLAKPAPPPVRAIGLPPDRDDGNLRWRV